MKFSRNEIKGFVVSLVTLVVVFLLVQWLFNNFDTTAEDTAPDVIVVEGNEVNEEQTGNALLDGISNSGEVRKLVVQDLVQGEGAEVVSGDVVTVHYVGSLIDGTEFENTVATGEPLTFTVGVGDVIEGWDRGLIGMKVGGQRILVIPTDMAYGNRSVGQIPANSALLFAIELLRIE